MESAMHVIIGGLIGAALGALFGAVGFGILDASLIEPAGFLILPGVILTPYQRQRREWGWLADTLESATEERYNVVVLDDYRIDREPEYLAAYG
jgi:hypothetical protein